jgi:hypothetical protein
MLTLILRFEGNVLRTGWPELDSQSDTDILTFAEGSVRFWSPRQFISRTKFRTPLLRELFLKYWYIVCLQQLQFSRGLRSIIWEDDGGILFQSRTFTERNRKRKKDQCEEYYLLGYNAA